MGHRIIFATGNEGKMREIRLILADLGLPILSMKEAGAEPEIVENGSTFGENAEIKARAVWNLTGDIGIFSNLCSYLGIDTSRKIFIFLFYKVSSLVCVLVGILFLALSIWYMDRRRKNL